MTKTAKAPERFFKEFKVAAISSNTGSFGHKEHILIARDGSAFEGCRQPNCHNPTIPDLKEGDVLNLEVSKDGNPCNYISHHFETMFPFRGGAAPANVVKEIWKGTETTVSGAKS